MLQIPMSPPLVDEHGCFRRELPPRGHHTMLVSGGSLKLSDDKQRSPMEVVPHDPAARQCHP